MIKKERALTWRRGCGGVRGMNQSEEFSRIVAAVLARFFAQNGREPLAETEACAVGVRLWETAEAHGWPRALAEGECGTPGGMSEEACAPLVAKVLAGAGDELLAKAVTQLVKACLYPEFTVCRDSYRELTKEGACKRQELARVRSRVSGTHCVDCPHWVTMTPTAHAEFLAQEWRPAGAAEWAEHRGIFLPEDFRALRQWLHARARAAGAS